MKKLANFLSGLVFVILCIGFLVYLVSPGFDFPTPPPDSVQSKEMADVETPLRRAYFTNMTRSEVMNHYKSQLKLKLFGYEIPHLNLNYPPEDSQTIIRDQTRSTFLEEIAYPLRESVYVNGFEPKEAKDAININGTPWRQKIIIRFVSTQTYIRVLLAIPTFILLYIVLRLWVVEILHIKNEN